MRDEISRKQRWVTLRDTPQVASAPQQPAEGCLDPVVGLLVQPNFGDQTAPDQALPEFSIHRSRVILVVDREM